MCPYLFAIFVFCSYVTNIATFSNNIQKHYSFYSIRFDGQEQPTEALVKGAVECARICVGNISECYGFGVGPDASLCQAFDIPTFIAADLSLSNTTQDMAVFDRVPQCPYWNDFVEVQANNSNFCYTINDSDNVTYSNASNLCQAKGGYLLRLDNQNEYDAVINLKNSLGMNDLNHWIGASDQLVEGEWLYEMDGLPIDWSVFRWKEPQPKLEPNPEDCAVLHGKNRYDIGIKDKRCGQLRGFICESQLR